jgi:uncharacterized phage-associated protein
MGKQTRPASNLTSTESLRGTAISSSSSWAQLSTSNTSSGSRFSVRSSGGGKVGAALITSSIVSDAIVEFCARHGDWITNQKLQKLLYYAQAWHLALYNRPMFPEEFQAWIHGPVEPTSYAAYASSGHGPIASANAIWSLPAKSLKHIEDVFESYGRLSAFDLERLACSEPPWVAARNGLAPDEPSDSIVKKEAMSEFYRLRLNEQKKR